MPRNIWLTVAHLPEHLNIEADRASRNFHDETEWKLNKTIYRKVVECFYEQDIDLFASRLNFQMKSYVSWQPDPEAKAVNAFTMDWSKFKFYAFPSFALVGRVLQKIEQDQATGILIVPKWSTQPWYPRLLQLLVQEHLLLSY